jgi:hypothetical protein
LGVGAYPSRGTQAIRGGRQSHVIGIYGLVTIVVDPIADLPIARVVSGLVVVTITTPADVSLRTVADFYPRVVVTPEVLIQVRKPHATQPFVHLAVAVIVQVIAETLGLGLKGVGVRTTPAIDAAADRDCIRAHTAYGTQAVRCGYQGLVVCIHGSVTVVVEAVADLPIAGMISGFVVVTIASAPDISVRPTARIHPGVVVAPLIEIHIREPEAAQPLVHLAIAVIVQIVTQRLGGPFIRVGIGTRPTIDAPADRASIGTDTTDEAQVVRRRGQVVIDIVHGVIAVVVNPVTYLGISRKTTPIAVVAIAAATNV